MLVFQFPHGVLVWQFTRCDIRFSIRFQCTFYGEYREMARYDAFNKYLLLQARAKLLLSSSSIIIIVTIIHASS